MLQGTLVTIGSSPFLLGIFIFRQYLGFHTIAGSVRHGVCYSPTLLQTYTRILRLALAIRLAGSGSLATVSGWSTAPTASRAGSARALGVSAGPPEKECFLRFAVGVCGRRNTVVGMSYSGLWQPRRMTICL
jgi:hypothetical protein